MRRLHILVLKSFIGPFVLIFFIVLFILLMQFLWRYIDDLVGKGLEIKVIAELLLYTSSSLVPMALPLSILMSSLMTFGNMGEFYELTAIKASGISLQRIMLPLMVLVIGISIGAFFFANDILPYTNLKMRSLLYDVQHQRPEIQIIPGSFYNGIEGYSVRVEKKDPETNILYDVKIYDHSASRGNTNVIIADSGKMIVTSDNRNLIFTLYHGFSYNEIESDRRNKRYNTYPHRFDKFDEQQMVIELVGFSLTRTDENLFRNHYSMLNLDQLDHMKDSIKNVIEDKKDLLVHTLLDGNYFKKRTRPNPKKHIIEKRDSMMKSAINPHWVRPDKSHAPELIKKNITEKINEPETQSEITEEVTDELNTDPEIYKSLFEKLNFKEQLSILDAALSYARSARSYVDGSSQNMDIKIQKLRRFEIEWHRKFTIAFACFVFLLIGAPLGAIIRKGGLGLPLVISTLFFIFYYIISLLGEKVVRESILPDYQGMWLASGLFFTVGIFLTYKATTDSSMLNFELYANAVRNFLGIRKLTVLDVIEKDSEINRIKPVNHDKLLATLGSFHDSVEESIEDVNTQLKFSGFLVSLVGIRESSNIVLLDRLYKNIMRSIRMSDLYGNLSVRNKLSEFPNFNYKYYLDLKAILYIKLVLLLVPPLTILIAARHYIQLLSLKARMKNISQLTTDLIQMVKKADTFDNVG
ncbi:MAG: LptF/LptG family permease [Bacteroidales bacterium]|nr:LptF/LptG family permease [Bacteroidales bacterium]